MVRAVSAIVAVLATSTPLFASRIGATTRKMKHHSVQEYDSYIISDGAFERRFRTGDAERALRFRRRLGSECMDLIEFASFLYYNVGYV